MSEESLSWFISLSSLLSSSSQPSATSASPSDTNDDDDDDHTGDDDEDNDDDETHVVPRKDSNPSKHSTPPALSCSSSSSSASSSSPTLRSYSPLFSQSPSPLVPISPGSSPSISALTTGTGTKRTRPEEEDGEVKKNKTQHCDIETKMRVQTTDIEPPDNQLVRPRPSSDPAMHVDSFDSPDSPDSSENESMQDISEHEMETERPLDLRFGAYALIRRLQGGWKTGKQICPADLVPTRCVLIKNEDGQPDAESAAQGLTLWDMPKATLKQLEELSPEQSSDLSLLIHPKDMSSQALARKLPAFLETLEDDIRILLLIRVPNTPRNPLALFRRETRAVPNALRPFLVSVSLHTDLYVSEALRIGGIVASFAPRPSNQPPATLPSWIFHKKSITSPLQDTQGHSFLEVVALFKPEVQIDSRRALSKLLTNLDEITLTSLIVTRKVSSNNHTLLTLIAAIPREHLAQIFGIIKTTWSDEADIVLWAGQIVTLDDTSSDQNVHLLISTHSEDRLPPLPSSATGILALTRLIHAISDTVTFVPLSFTSLFVVLPQTTYSEFIQRLPPQLTIRLLTTTEQKILSRQALVVHPELKKGQKPGPALLNQLGETSSACFRTN